MEIRTVKTRWDYYTTLSQQMEKGCAGTQENRKSDIKGQHSACLIRKAFSDKQAIWEAKRKEQVGRGEQAADEEGVPILLRGEIKKAEW